MQLKNRVVVLLVLVDIAVSLALNGTKIDEINNNLEGLETRRRRVRMKKKGRSTSSDEAGYLTTDETSNESLNISPDDTSTSSGEDVRKPKSSAERKGWRKWHRKCKPCPEDMTKKWRDPSIKWICGAYQRARRSFKSKCMMEYRNCQDGTMFVHIHDHRCADSVAGSPQLRGEHFFYDYRVALSDDSSDSKSSRSKSSQTDDTSDSI